MLLRHGKHWLTSKTVTYVTVNILTKTDIFKSLSSGRFPLTWKAIRRWIVRQAFVRVVRMLVNVRRASANYKPMDKTEFKSARQKLLKTGRTKSGMSAQNDSAAAASSATESEEMNISVAEIQQAKERIEASFGNSADVGQMQQSLESEDHHVAIGSGGGGGGGGEVRLAKLETDVQALQGALQTTQAALQSSIDDVAQLGRANAAKLDRILELLAPQRNSMELPELPDMSSSMVSTEAVRHVRM